MIDAERRCIKFKGIIQGVGFRPTIYRCALHLGLSGFVRNQKSEVMAEIQGTRRAVDEFPELLKKMLPGAAQIEHIDINKIPLKKETQFFIAPSKATAYSFPPIPPDLAICPECRKELFDPLNRRYLYPFITCTQCGPRYSIVEDTPFDRETTSMADFIQCPACLNEYTNPRDRRFHSQTNSCTECGPKLLFKSADGKEISGDPVIKAIEALKAGKVIAVQGIGGFHLAAVPGLKDAVENLRRDKERERKPFALMLCDAEEAKELCIMEEEDLKLLMSPAAPIMIFPAKGNMEYQLRISNTNTLGIMLPYTPLHLLLFYHPDVLIPYRHLIMTSGNLKGEPIVTDPKEAFQKLGGIADFFLYHNRRIIFRTDDSIVRRTETHDVLLRRSRGYVPHLISLKTPVKKIILGVGGDLKSAPALAKGSDVYLAPFLGDLDDPATGMDFERQIDKILSLYGIEPNIIAYDLHPLYHSTRWALSAQVENKIGIQHHHAHLLSVMAEHQLTEVIGLSFDGTGYGSDGTIWGGEFMYATRSSFKRLGCFKPFLLPGGESAVRHPIRIALSILFGQLSNLELETLFCRDYSIDPLEFHTLISMLEKKTNSPTTSSLGRIFDAAAALIGLVCDTGYEAEGPIRLEGLALQECMKADPIRDIIPLSPSDGLEDPFTLDAGPLLAYIARHRNIQSPGLLALLFHRAITQAAVRGVHLMKENTTINSVVLSGGVFQNTLLLNLLVPELIHHGYEVYTNRKIPPGDGGIAVGQVYFLPEND